jgi:hypothetical protein
MSVHPDYSLAALARFAHALRDLTHRGESWAVNLATAIRTVLRFTDIPAEQDVRALDLDAVLEAFATTAGDELSRTSIGTYTANFRRAVRCFIDYTDGRPVWDSDRRTPRPGPPGGAALLAHALPLRAGMVIRFLLPADLTVAEARRLTRFIKALVIDSTAADPP